MLDVKRTREAVEFFKQNDGHVAWYTVQSGEIEIGGASLALAMIMVAVADNHFNNRCTCSAERVEVDTACRSVEAMTNLILKWR